MTEVYRKRGVTVRWENGTRVRVTESGVAIEDGGLFTCHPEIWSAATPVAALESDGVAAALAALESGDWRRHTPDVRIERLVISQGVAEHTFNDRTWREETQRIHLSLVHGRTRALVDAFHDIPRVAEALARCGEERGAPPRLRLAPSVSAALIPSLTGVPNIELWQTAGGTDGKGNAIEEVRIDASTTPPNFYRPSYRVRPIRMPLDVRVRCAVTEIERDRPVAVALLAPAEGLTMRVLIDDGENAWPATVRVTRIAAVSEVVTWYPYGGGSFGAEMML